MVVPGPFPGRARFILRAKRRGFSRNLPLPLNLRTKSVKPGYATPRIHPGTRTACAQGGWEATYNRVVGRHIQGGREAYTHHGIPALYEGWAVFHSFRQSVREPVLPPWARVGLNSLLLSLIAGSSSLALYEGRALFHTFNRKMEMKPNPRTGRTLMSGSHTY